MLPDFELAIGSHEQGSQSSSEDWLRNYTQRRSRQWRGLLRDCPFTIVRIKAIPFNIDNIANIECAMWLANNSTNGLDFSLIIESNTPNRSIYVSHMRYVLWHDPRIAGVICQDDTMATLFKLTFPDLLYTR